MNFDVKNRLTRRDYAPVDRLNCVGQVREHFTHGSAEMNIGWYTVDLGQMVIDADIPQLGIDEGGAVAIFHALGLDPAAGLSLALVRRVREAAWIAIGLLLLGLDLPTPRTAVLVEAD